LKPIDHSVGSLINHCAFTLNSYRWVGEPSPTDPASNERSHPGPLGELDQGFSGTPSSTTAPTRSPIMMQDLCDRSRGRVSRDEDCSDPLLLPKGTPLPVDLSCALYHAANNPPSNSSSPLTSRKPRYTIVPMKPVVDEISDTVLSKRRGK
jgi:hypothetical protein